MRRPGGRSGVEERLCLALSIVGIVKAFGGQRWRMPVAADIAQRLDL